MKKLLSSLLFMSVFAVVQAGTANKSPIQPTLAFTENRGQVVDSEGKPRADVLFTAENNGVRLYFRNDAVSYVFSQIEKEGDQSVLKARFRSDIRFVGANPYARVTSEQAQPFVSHYYQGSQAITGVRSYERITYHNIYPNIDLVFYTVKNQSASIKYEFIVHPGGNPDQIQLQYEGFKNLSIDRAGVVNASTPLGSIADEAPVTFQGNETIASYYQLKNGVVSFKVGAYDQSKDLVIDPLTRQFSFNRGGNSFDRAMGVDIDANGNTILAGWTTNNTFPGTVGGFQPASGGDNDAVILQVSPTGTILWATYFGGAGRDQALAIAIGANNTINVGGTTTSTNFPVTNGAFQTTAGGGGDGFVFQLATNGTRNWASYFGGSSNDQVSALDVFSNGEVAVAGRTFSTSGIATVGNLNGTRDAFLARVAANGTSRVWSKYVGGANDEQGWAVAVDANDNVYLAGQTSSLNLATPGVMQTTLRSSTDAFIARFSGTGTQNWFSYYGGNDLDFITALDIDANGNVFGTGITSSITNFPLSNNVFQSAFGGLQDAFLFASNPSGGLIMSTYIGGSSTEQGYGIAVVGNHVYVTGSSNSPNFTTVNPNAVNLPFQQSNAGSFDFFLLKVNTSNFTRSWSILHGGASDDVARALSADGQGRIAVAGYSNSANFTSFPSPIQGQGAPGVGNDDMIVLNLTDDVAGCPAVNVTSTTTNAFCSALPSGSIKVTAPVGANYTYSLTGASVRPAQGSVDFFDLPSGNYTLRAKNNTDNCEYTQSVTVGADIPFQVATSKTNPACGLGGNITVNAPIGGEFTYALSGPINLGDSPNNVFSNLIAGSYIVTVKDGTGCEVKTAEIVLSDANTLAAPALTSTNATCATAFDAGITVTAPVGQGVTYALNGAESRPAQSSPFFGNLAPGAYSVIAFAGNCTSIATTITVNAGNGLMISAGTNPTTCDISADGSIIITAPLGANTTYSLEGVESRPAQPSTRFDNLKAGAYMVTARDGQGCSGSMTFTVGVNPNPPAVVVSTLPTTCVNNNNGTLTIISPTPSGARYTLRGNNVTVENSATNVFGNLPSGTYFASVLLPNGCTLNANPAFISNPSQLAASATGGTIACGSSNGTINVTATGGSGTLQYELAGPVNRPKQSSNVFSGLSAGNYNIVVTDANGCATTASASVDLPGNLGLQTTSSATTCGQTNGTITVTSVTGGTGTVLYSIIAGPVLRDPQTNQTFTNLQPGDYTVRITDANNCSATAPVTVVQGPNSLILNPVVDPILCKGGTANITVNVTGNTGDMIYTLSGRAPQPGNNRFANVTPGIYTLTVVDSRNCTASQTINITEPTQLTASATVTQISCPNQQLGQIIVSSTGGTGAKMFTLTGPVTVGPQTSGTFTNLNPGTYRATVMDANGCSVDVANALIINTINRVQIGSLVPMMPKCNAGNDGSITVNLAPATGTPPFAYRINNGAYSPTTTNTSYIFGLLTAGSYTVDVRDGNGCIATSTINLSEPSVISATASGTVPTSCVVGDGSLTVTATGGTPPYMYSLDGANFQVSNRFDFIQAGFYEITVRDNNNCTGKTTLTLNHANAPKILNVSVRGTECFTNNGANTGQIIIAASGAPNLFYSINDGISFTASGSGSMVFSDLAVGTYLIRVSDVNGCTAFWPPVTVDAPVPFIIQNVIVTNPVCSNTNPVGGTIEIQATGGKLPLRFSVDGGRTFSLSNRITDLYPRVGGYQIVVVDANGCEALGGGTRNMFNASGLILDPSLVSFTQPNCGSNDGTITVRPTGGSPGAKRYYVNGNLDGTSSNTSYTFRNLAEGEYTIRVVDAAGCCVEANVTLATITVRTTPTAGACNGAFGNILTEVEGGTGNYQYTLTGTAFQIPAFAVIPVNRTFPGGTSFDFTGLYPGSYEITILDLGNPAGCTRKVKVVLGTQNGPNITNVTKIDRVCSGATQVSSTTIGSISAFTTGAIAVHLIGTTNIIGQGPVNNATTFTQPTGLMAGEYVVFADNGNGCFTAYPTAITITEPTPIVITGVDITQPRCGGNATGSIMVRATGGRTLEYSMDGGVSFQAAATFNNLAPGVPIGANWIIVREQGTGLNCWTSWPLQIDINNEGNFAMAAPVVSNQTCSGTPDGSITINVTGGRLPISFTLTPEVGPVQTFTGVQSLTQAFTGLQAGNYVAQAVDANGCIAVLAGPITISATLETLTITPTIAGSCNGGGEFSLTINTPNLADTYTISVDNGVTSLSMTSTPNLNMNPAPNVAVLVQNLAPGNYNVIVTNQRTKCKIAGSVTIANTSADDFQILSLQVRNPDCPGTNSGEVVATIRFGTGGGSATLSGFNPRNRGTATTATFTWSNLFAGNYTLTLTGNGGTCITPYVHNITLTAPTPVTFTTEVTSASCTGLSGTPDGRIIVRATGGVGPYLYSINGGGNYTTNNIFTGLTPGDYQVVVRDAGTPNSCPAVTDPNGNTRVTSTSNFYLDVSTSPLNGGIQSSCPSPNNAYIEVLLINPPVNPVFYLNGQPVVPVLTPFFQDLIVRIDNVVAQNNALRVVDALGCFDELNINIPATTALNITSATTTTSPSCGTSNDGIVQIQVTGGTDAGTPNPPLTGRQYTFADYFTVTTPTPNIVPQTGQVIIAGLSHGVYDFNVFNARDNARACALSRYVAVNSVGAPGIQACAANISRPTAPNCNNGQVRITASNSCSVAQGGVVAYQRRQQGQANWTTNPLGATNPTFRNLTPGVYVFRARYGSNCFAYTTPVTVTAVGTCVGPKEMAVDFFSEQEMNIYPNPTKGEFTLKLASSESENLTVKVVDMTGRVILDRMITTQEGVNEIPFDMSGVTDGVYVMTVNRNGSLTTLKVVKN